MSRLRKLENRIKEVEMDVENNRPVTGTGGIYVTDVQGGGGRSINWRGRAGGSTSAAGLAPLQPFDASTSMAYILGITAGALGAVDVTTPSPLKFTLAGVVGSIWASLDVDSVGVPVAASATLFDNGSSAPPAPDPSTVYQLIATYDATGTPGTDVLIFNPMVNGSQGVTVCFSDPSTGNAVPAWTLV